MKHLDHNNLLIKPLDGRKTETVHKNLCKLAPFRLQHLRIDDSTALPPTPAAPRGPASPSHPRPHWEDNEEIDLGEPEDYVDSSDSTSSDSETSQEPENQDDPGLNNPNLTLEHPDPEEIIQDLGDTLDSPDLPDTDEGDFNDSFHSVPDDNSAPNSATER